MRYLPLLFACLFCTCVRAQTPNTQGTGGAETTNLATGSELDELVGIFEENNVGFLHVYIDPNVDPLETYLFRGLEMGEGEVAQLPESYLSEVNTDEGRFYASMAIQGIEENLYLVRYDGTQRDRIDQFALRDGQMMHLKTLAYLNCDTPGDCGQLDSYITDVNLDTDFDLIQISRASAADTNEERHVYTMPRASRMWVETTELDVPWEGITFYKHPSASRKH
ncbi:hypothetical protein LEM8419_03117 [Neolewinella maritima]|uniref:Uncharacterized protein n=1 Tax=Neolewinella maritima TaxID=1383882 RepID=A0ABM9B4M7_9BACT|nr:hypothetical protein [Neolewinella maritima]CAH1002200.1 hypothetical protein LEM8419_03117 [Neolewinella maritima]